MKRRTALASVVALVMGLGCAGRHAQGTLGAVEIRGRVDSSIARAYLTGHALPTDLERVRNDYLRAGAVPSRDELAVIARAYSPDVATLLFIESVAALPKNRALRSAYTEAMAELRAIGIDAAQVEGKDDVLVLFVPGWFYASHGDETGADFHGQRELLSRLGVAHDLVATHENGVVEENAATVANAIRRHAAAGRRVVVVSASKSGAEVALALGSELAADETEAVIAWLSIGGVVKGSPFADRMLEPDMCWIAELKLRREGFDMDGLVSMRTMTRRAAFATLDLPPHVLYVSYVAAPLGSHISKRGDFGYARMRKEGPNDGLTLLADELLPDGLALVEPGVDHFFVGSDLDLRAVAILEVLLRWSREPPK